MKTNLDKFLEGAEPLLRHAPKVLTGIRILFWFIVIVFIGDKIIDFISAHVWSIWFLDAVFLFLWIFFLYKDNPKYEPHPIIATSMLLIGIVLLLTMKTFLWNIFVFGGIIIIALMYAKIKKM